MRLPLQVHVLASGFAPMLLHPHRLPDGAVKGRVTRGQSDSRGTGINPGIRCGCLNCRSGGAVRVMLLPYNCQQFNRATFQAHSGRFRSVSYNFDVGNKKKRLPAL